jgi:hypothetical protein
MHRIDRPKPRYGLMASGLVGLVLAPLIYCLTARSGGLLRGWEGMRAAEAVIFLGLLAVALVEVPAMVFALRMLSRSSASRWFLYAANAAFVAFAAVYAAVLNLLFGQSFFSGLLASLSVVRWISGRWIR